MRVDELTLDPTFIPEYLNALQSLERSRLLEYLRTKGLDYLHLPYKDIQESALNGAKAAGWQACLNAIEEFKTTLGTTRVTKEETPRADFGSLERLTEAGELTTEEKEALKNGTTPNYSEFINPKRTDTGKANS